MKPRMLLLAACFVVLFLGEAASALDFAPLERVVAAELKRNQVPGCAVAIVHGDQILFAKGFGVANLDTGEPVRADMLFRLGSTTKMFTAGALVSLAEEGKVNLQAPIAVHIPRLAKQLGRVSAHQLLTHTAGLADLTVMEGPHDEAALRTNSVALPASIAFAEPGEVYSYSNPGYWLAGHLAEAVSGRLYADVVTERLLRPCGMVRSTFRPTEAMTWPLAVGHGPEGRGEAKVIRPLADNAGAWPAGQLFASAPEFARFCLAFLNEGRLEGRQVLSPGLIAQLGQPHVKLPGVERHYGYGLAVKEEQGLRWLSHGGSRTGYGSHVRMCPEKRFAVIVLANKTGAGLTVVADQAVELVLGLKPERAPARRDWKLTEAEAQKFSGAYTNGRLTIPLIASGDRLLGGPGATIRRVGETQFVRESGGNRPATEFQLVADQQGVFRYLIQNGRAFKRMDP